MIYTVLKYFKKKLLVNILNITFILIHIVGSKNVYKTPRLCFMLLDGAAVIRETTESRLN